jgi:predicted dehydrogenase
MSTARRGRVVAVGSRSGASAEAFAARFSVAKAHASYDALLADDSVQAIYLSLPNSMHREWTIRALRAGKHVLCEKPIAMNEAEVQEMFEVARQTSRQLVEAFMYRSHPQTKSALETIRSGAIGQVQLIKTSFCYRTRLLDGNIRFRPELGGGATMDVGCYCIGFARLVAGQEPDRILAAGKIHSSGVDESAAATLHFPNGIVGSAVCGMTVQADNTAYVCGTEGYIEIPIPWKPQRESHYSIAYSIPPQQDVAGAGVPVRPPRTDVPIETTAELYALEADDFAASVFDGAPPMVSAEESSGNMRVLDEIRRQIGLKY